MFKRFLSILLASLLLWHVAGAQSRAEWVDEMTRIAGPVLENLAQGTLKANMPFESLSKDPLRKEVSYLEAFGRTVCGIAPRLELGPDTFDGNGWLRVGFAGSLYLCMAAFLPLGLPETDPFWSRPDADWTSRKAWNGIDVGADHAR